MGNGNITTEEYNLLKKAMEDLKTSMDSGFLEMKTLSKEIIAVQNNHENRILLLEKENEFVKDSRKDNFHQVVTVISLLVGLGGLIAAFLAIK